jgi:hypothetical protein
MNDSKEGRETPVLLTALLEMVSRCVGLYKQKRVYNRMLGLVMAELFAFGRHTITQLLLTLGLTDEEWSGWYRLFSEGRFRAEETSEQLLREVFEEVPKEMPLVVGVDGFHVPRCSQSMAGTGWMRGLQTAKFQPGLQRGQRFVEGSWLTPLVDGYSRAIPLRCLPAFTAKSVPNAAYPPQTEVEAGLVFLHWTRQQMDTAGRCAPLLVTLHDGSFDTLAFWSGLPERTVAIVRTARNRCLYALPPADAHGNRLYGEKAPAPHHYLKQRKGFSSQEVMVRGRLRRMRYRVEGPFVRDGLPHVPLMLIVIGGGKRPPGSRRQKYEPCFFLVSAVWRQGAWTVPLPLDQLLAWLWQRWELEIAHRNLKSGLGLGEKQCWNDQATVATVQWSVWLYALLLLAGFRVWGDLPGRQPPGLWRSAPRRWSFTTLLRAFRSEMWSHSDFRTTWLWSRHNWLENELLWEALFNSILATSRL